MKRSKMKWSWSQEDKMNILNWHYPFHFLLQMSQATFSFKEQFSRIERASPYLTDASWNFFSLTKAFPCWRNLGTASSCSFSSICHISFSYSSGWRSKRQLENWLTCRREKPGKEGQQTSNTGSQYRRGRVGSRGSQPSSTPHAHQPHTSIQNTRFSTFRLVLTDGWTDGQTDGRTKPLI